MSGRDSHDRVRQRVRQRADRDRRDGLPGARRGRRGRVLAQPGGRRRVADPVLRREEQRALGVPARNSTTPTSCRPPRCSTASTDFDAALFGMTPREAELTDPQHRLFLELRTPRWRTPATTRRATRARSASTPAPAAPTTTGGDHSGATASRGVAGTTAVSTGAATCPDYVATLVSYKLNLRGPSARPCTPPAPRRWSPSTWPARRCAPASATWRWPVACRVELPHGRATSTHEGGITSPDGHCRSVRRARPPAPSGAAASG